MTEYRKKILIATGGTGGHVFPAYSLARHFIKNRLSVDIVTDKRGFEFLKNYKDVRLKVINSSTIFKKNPLKIIISLIQIKIAFIRALFFLLKSRPKIVFGMGGYSSFPVCIAAKILNIPFLRWSNRAFLPEKSTFALILVAQINPASNGVWAGPIS